eukprot:g2693.t1
MVPCWDNQETTCSAVQFYKSTDTSDNMPVFTPNLAFLYPDMFANLTNLQAIDLSYNLFTTLEYPAAWRSVTTVVRLSAASNSVTDITFLANASLGATLEYLNLARNNIAFVERDSFAGYANLQSVDLSKNALEAVSRGAFRETTQLVVLKLDSNFLVSVPSDLMRNMPVLRFLDLSNNRLQELPVGAFKTASTFSFLEVLDLSRNDIENIAHDQFLYNARLKYLLLTDNLISRLRAGTFGSMIGLEAFVSLSYNPITEIEEDSIQAILCNPTTSVDMLHTGSACTCDTETQTVDCECHETSWPVFLNDSNHSSSCGINGYNRIRTQCSDDNARTGSCVSIASSYQPFTQTLKGCDASDFFYIEDSARVATTGGDYIVIEKFFHPSSNFQAGDESDLLLSVNGNMGPQCIASDVAMTPEGHLALLCEFPAGAGRGASLTIESNKFADILLFDCLYAYNVPIIHNTSGCDPSTGCSRSGHDEILTIHGHNFGVSNAVVFVGGEECANVEHVGADGEVCGETGSLNATSCNSIIRCSLPPLTSYTSYSHEISIGIVQSNLLGSSMSERADSYVSYERCRKGTFQTETACDESCPQGFDSYLACVECPRGSYSELQDAFVCSDCQSGSFSTEVGVSQCQLCPEGKYTSSTANTRCVDCHAYSTANVGAEICEGCDFWYLGSRKCKFPFMAVVVGIGASVMLATATLLISRWSLKMKRQGTRLKREAKTLKKEVVLKNSSIALLSADVEQLKKVSNLKWSDIRLTSRRPFAKGSYGKVWHGILNRLHPCAVKVLKNSERMADYDDKEIAFLQRVRHANLVWFFGFGRTPRSKIFLAFEFMNRGDLSKLIWNKKSRTRDDVPPWSTRLSLLRDAASGISYLHSAHDAIHRDLKSANILLASVIREDAHAADGNDEVSKKGAMLRTEGRGANQWVGLVGKVADFGMAKALMRRGEVRAVAPNGTSRGNNGTNVIDTKTSTSSEPGHCDDASLSSLESTCSVAGSNDSSGSGDSFSKLSGAMTADCGTVEWMCPEVIEAIYSNAEKSVLTQDVDTYAFGIIMWECLSLKAPWKGTGQYFKIWSKVKRGFRPPINAEDHRNAPVGYVRFMKRCWAHTPSDRPKFDEVVRVIDGMLQAHIDKSRPSASATWSPGGRSRPLWMGELHPYEDSPDPVHIEMSPVSPKCATPLIVDDGTSSKITTPQSLIDFSRESGSFK